jgi:hypothetical protein
LKSKTKRQNLPQIYADERGSEEIARIAMIAKDRNGKAKPKSKTLPMMTLINTDQKKFDRSSFVTLLSFVVNALLSSAASVPLRFKGFGFS